MAPVPHRRTDSSPIFAPAPTRDQLGIQMDQPRTNGSPPLSEKHARAREALPDELRPIFDALVAEYKFLASIHHKSPFVSYLVLADLVRNGWRPQPKP